MASDEEEDDEDLDEEDIDKDDSPAFAASGALDTLAISLPADKYITSLMAQVCIYFLYIYLQFGHKNL